MTYVRVWDPLERFLFAMAITFLVMCTFLYILRGKKRENFTERIMMYGFACIFIHHAIGFFFIYLRAFAIPGFYIDFIYYGDYEKIGPTYKTLSKLVYVSTAVTYIFFLLAFEISVKRTKYILTTIQVIISIIIIILPYESARLFHHIIYYPFRTISLMIIFYLFTKWSRIEFKAVSSFLLVGIGIIMVGSTLASRDVVMLNIVPLYIYPPLMILGTFIAILPLIMDPKHFSKALFLWKLNGAIVISILCGFYVFFIYYFGFFYYNSLILVLYTSIFLYIYYLTISIIKNEQRLDSKDVSKENIIEKRANILGIFTRPEKITEEEVSISKEKKICLVCKGKVSGINFLCRECESFYCEKCYNALIGIENLCWACDAVLDESKPFKRLEKEEKETLVDEKVRKEKL